MHVDDRELSALYKTTDRPWYRTDFGMKRARKRGRSCSTSFLFEISKSYTRDMGLSNGWATSRQRDEVPIAQTWGLHSTFILFIMLVPPSWAIISV